MAGYRSLRLSCDVQHVTASLKRVSTRYANNDAVDPAFAGIRKRAEFQDIVQLGKMLVI